MRGAAERGHLVIGLGDFNMVPLSLAHRIIESQAPVRDVWRVAHPNSSIGAAINPAEQARGYPIPTAEYNLQRNGATCDSVLNTWRWEQDEQKQLAKGQDRVIDLRTEDPKAKRLDYVFFGGGEGMEDVRTWRVENVEVGMTMRHPTLLCSLSDHFSVEATITCQPQGSNLSGNGSEHGTNSTSAKQASALIIPQTSHLSPEIYRDIKEMITKYTLRERQQRRWRLGHFVGQVTIAIGCFVAIWFSPRNYVSFILILLSTLGLSAGVIDGLIGGLFVSGEIRALKEFEWEIENAIAVGQREKERIGEGEENWRLARKVEAERFDVNGEGRSSLGVNGC
jgi:sphingomyelin phosphodiesterase 2